ncbi:MAG: hypothetical protein QUS14_15830, partial [Pyrinomonadaceae bacterium]|nr:hypothetical protein [Pyrinomonadaceae bacterium]
MSIRSHAEDDELFGSSTKKGSNKTIIIVTFAALLLFGGAGYGLYRYSAPEPPDLSAIRSAEIKETMVFLLAQPSFSGDEFREQLLGRGRIAKYAWKEKQVYFTYPEASEEEFQAFLSKHIAVVSKVDFGKTVNGTIRLDDYELRPGP